MKRLRLALTLALVLLAAPLLAGCIGTAAATAAENRDKADQAARQWDAGAQLAQVVGVEGSFSIAGLAAMAGYGGSSDDTKSNDFESSGQDEQVGDGRAEVWVYRYIARSKDTALVVVLDKEGNILRQGEETRGREYATPIGTWTIDSDAALSIAKSHNTALAKGIDGKQFGIVSVLQHETNDAHATWFIAGGGGDLSGAGGGFVQIDAETGEVLASEGGFGSMSDFARSWN